MTRRNLPWAAWSGPGFRERGDQDALVADVLTAYSKLSADETIALPRKLDAALTEMSNKLGVRA